MTNLCDWDEPALHWWNDFQLHKSVKHFNIWCDILGSVLKKDIFKYANIHVIYSKDPKVYYKCKKKRYCIITVKEAVVDICRIKGMSHIEVEILRISSAPFDSDVQLALLIRSCWLSTLYLIQWVKFYSINRQVLSLKIDLA